eukprot:8687644-Pyramimonas_sp.AAC.1
MTSWALGEPPGPPRARGRGTRRCPGGRPPTASPILTRPVVPGPGSVHAPPGPGPGRRMHQAAGQGPGWAPAR